MPVGGAVIPDGAAHQLHGVEHGFVRAQQLTTDVHRRTEVIVDYVGRCFIDDVVDFDPGLGAGVPGAAGRLVGRALAARLLLRFLHEYVETKAQLVEAVGGTNPGRMRNPSSAKRSWSRVMISKHWRRVTGRGWGRARRGWPGWLRRNTPHLALASQTESARAASSFPRTGVCVPSRDRSRGWPAW